MSSPLAYGDTSIAEDIVQAGRNGNDVRLLILGDSEDTTINPWISKAWRPYNFAGVWSLGSQVAGAGDPNSVLTQFLPGGVTSAVTGGAMNYSLLGSAEMVFNGGAYGADGSILSNRVGALVAPNTQASFGVASRTANTFDGLDNLNGVALQFQALMYVDGSSYLPLRYQIRNDAGNNAWGGPFSQTQSAAAGAWWLSPLMQGSASDTSGINFEIRFMPSTAPTNGQRFVSCGYLLRKPTPGLILIDASQGGYTIDSFLDTTKYSTASLNAQLGIMKPTHAMISLTTNNPGAYNQAQYLTRLLNLVAAIRSSSAAGPGLKIIFNPSWDSNEAGGGPHEPGFADAHYQACQQTPGSLFLNTYRSDGLRAIIQAEGLATAADVHPTTTYAKYYVAAQRWALLERAAGNGRFMNLTSGAHRIRGF